MQLLRLMRTGLLIGATAWGGAAHLAGASAQEAASPAAAQIDSRLIAVHCTDGSVLHVRLIGEPIELVTAYGTLRIPVEEVQRLRCGIRPSEAEAEAIQAAIENLRRTQNSEREAARARLLDRPQLAYPRLLRASRTSDLELLQHLEEAIAAIEARVPAEELSRTEDDVVETADSKFFGRISAAALSVQTAQFGPQQLRLADVRTAQLLRLAQTSAEAPAAEEVQPDPGNLKAYEAQVGRTFAFRVTGGAHAGTVWGTDTYTTDSPLSVAAVHAGVLKPGETGVVRVKIHPSPPSFAGSTRYGITTSPYGPYSGAYEVLKPEKRRRP